MSTKQLKAQFLLLPLAHRNTPFFYTATDAERALFAFLTTIPKDALIAGDPCLLDSIPLFGQRMVLASCEEPRSPRRVMDMLDAYYADDGRDLLEFCRKYGVTHLVINEFTLGADFVATGAVFFEPYNSQVIDQIKQRDRFILDDIPAHLRLFYVPPVIVITCELETVMALE